MSDPKQKLSAEDIQQANLNGWTHNDDHIAATFATGDFATGLKLVNLIGDDAEKAGHHPDITLTYPEVSVTLSSHDVGGLTSRDVELARKINGHAGTLDVAVK